MKSKTETREEKDLKESIGMTVILIMDLYLISQGDYKAAMYGLFIVVSWFFSLVFRKNKKLKAYLSRKMKKGK